MFRYIVQKMPEATRQNTSLYDVTLYYSEGGGVTWVRATEENFPKDGVTVVLPYPAGTNAADFDFVVTHMLTVGTPGAVEIPAVTKNRQGSAVYLAQLVASCGELEGYSNRAGCRAGTAVRSCAHSYPGACIFRGSNLLLHLPGLRLP